MERCPVSGGKCSIYIGHLGRRQSLASPIVVIQYQSKERGGVCFLIPVLEEKERLWRCAS